MKCSKCGKEFGEGEQDARVISISGSIMGDESIESYYFCKDCGVYMVEVYNDNFTGVESVSTYGPLSKEKGDAKVELIKRCSRPWDKKCRCKAHKEYFGGWLD